MAEFQSETKHIDAPAEKVFERLSNLENLRELLQNVPEDRVPADKLEQLRKVEITPDSISIPGGPTGKVTLRLYEKKAPNLIVFKAADIPLDLNLAILISPKGDDSCGLATAIEANLPAMLKPMVKGPFNQIVTQMTGMLSAIPY